MFRKPIPHKKNQQGNMIIVVVFVLVVMGMLAANMSRVGWSNQDTLTREYLGTQAWFLAHSANEWALTTLFPINQSDSTDDLSSRCTVINGQTGVDAATALAANIPCEAPTIICNAPESSIPADLQYYNVTTTAVCGDATIFQVQRVQEVWAKGVK